MPPIPQSPCGVAVLHRFAWGMGVGGLCPPSPNPHRTGKAPQAKRCTGCDATQAEQSDAKAKGCKSNALGLHCFAMRASVQRNGLGVALQGNAEGGGGRALRSNATSGPCPSLHPVGLTGVRRSAGRMHGNALGVALQGNARLRGASAPLLHCLLHRFACCIALRCNTARAEPPMQCLGPGPVQRNAEPL
jgi:hypothetical protein